MIVSNIADQSYGYGVPSSRVIEFREPKEIAHISHDGKVTLGEHLDLQDVENLPLPHLLLLREILEKAISNRTKP